jgi:hypothetical protein
MPMFQGPIAWAKLGKPQPGYTKSQLEWSFDVGLDKNALKALADAGVTIKKYVKPGINPQTGKEHVLGTDHLKFSRKEIKADGTPAQRIRVVDRKGNPFDTENTKIGNGSIVNVKFAVNETQNGDMKPAVVALQIWELVEYEGGENFPTDDKW